MKTRCTWCLKTEIEQDYHDQEWGLPLFDDNLLYEAIVLDGAQAGLSWVTILKRREGYRRAFAHFDPQKVARFTPKKMAALAENPEIIRNRQKITSAVNNAKCTLKIQEEWESLAAFIWSFVDYRPIVNAWKTMGEIPTTSPVAEKMSREMKGRGFTFFGPTICYALMQATGMVNDHTTDCFRYGEIIRFGKKMTTARFPG